MNQYKAYKVELDPNNKQITLFKKHCGGSRFAYNWMLATLKQDYDKSKLENTKPTLKPNAIQFHKLLNSKKQTEFPWMYEVSKSAPQFALKAVEGAYKRFFNKEASFPRFKKKGIKDSFTVDGTIIINKDSVQLPRIGKVRLKESNYIPEGKPAKATISRRADKWFISVHYETDITQQNYIEDTIGVDLGIKNLITCSDGTVIPNSNKLKQLDKSLKRQQRKLARQTKGGSSYNKTKLKIQRLYMRISNSRQDILHKTTSLLVKTKPEKTIVIEDLNVKGMMKNHKLARAIGNCGWGEFVRQLKYKCEWYGKTLIIANRFFPSSKMDWKTGEINKDLKLSDRTIFHKDGTTTDRDLQGAINLKLYPEKYMVEYSTVSSTGIKADVSLKLEKLNRDGKFINSVKGIKVPIGSQN